MSHTFTLCTYESPAERHLIEEWRGRRVGGALLRCAQRAFKGSKLLVEPDGYNVDPERQRHFYTRNGFNPDEKLGCLVWDGRASASQQSPPHADGD